MLQQLQLSLNGKKMNLIRNDDFLFLVFSSFTCLFDFEMNIQSMSTVFLLGCVHN